MAVGIPQAVDVTQAHAIGESVTTLLKEAHHLRGQALRLTEKAKRLETSARKLVRRQPTTNRRKS